MTSHLLQYAKYGTPSSVIRVVKQTLDFKLSAHEVLLKFLAAPINPSDYNQIEGKYPVKPALPAVGGNEGAATVLAIGRDVRSVKQGDTVIPGSAGFGTWRTFCVCNEGRGEEDSRRFVGFCCGNACGKPVYRLQVAGGFPKAVRWWLGDTERGKQRSGSRCHPAMRCTRGSGLLNVIRNRDNAAEVKSELMSAGGDAVFTSSERGEIEQFCAENTPHLALNMVGGRDTIQLLKCLGEGSSLVTYGAMSNSPMSVPFGLMVFKDITLHNYWMTRWSRQHGSSLLEDRMFGQLAEWYKSGELTPTPHQTNSFYGFQDALDNAFKVKQLFVVEETLNDPRHED